jgi:hypothetical protein
MEMLFCISYLGIDIIVCVKKIEGILAYSCWFVLFVVDLNWPASTFHLGKHFIRHRESI